jgi:hypothetical protein
LAGKPSEPDVTGNAKNRSLLLEKSNEVRPFHISNNVMVEITDKPYIDLALARSIHGI